MSDEQPSINERLAAITNSLELLSVNVHAMQNSQNEFRMQQERLPPTASMPIRRSAVIS
jgi:hypothetical protein